ncbi:uncharacterized protein BP01DRAFT_359765 [Aspergillus saccharolyticus JOP 1030-1]|uniref:Uncharacterized protein n=1 Tax=Aspergillus saccharolyticus JOP 1030-1 TaxID=1450539 RepID=A0A318ZEW8_9EURO|nr:hypothetical protein BP01DRAFT_359765 [Aspergillus saccharolyticus JOP 1030-1]PYH42150.1 hypothetical protein BP01DRAFT_359765 [Aspergillus saccharolyticus JOP 1030-1]
MTVGEKIEQYFTGRPNSYVPGHTLERLLSLPARPDSERFGLNMAMHYGQGAAAAIIRALMSANGIRGPFADFMFISIRLLIDQTLENVTGVGALPWTWPVNEQIIDILHKGVFAVVTGYFTDRWLQGQVTVGKAGA